VLKYSVSNSLQANSESKLLRSGVEKILVGTGEKLSDVLKLNSLERVK